MNTDPLVSMFDRAVGAEGIFWQLWKIHTQGMLLQDVFAFEDDFRSLLVRNASEEEVKSFDNFLAVKRGQV